MVLLAHVCFQDPLSSSEPSIPSDILPFCARKWRMSGDMRLGGWVQKIKLGRGTGNRK